MSYLLALYHKIIVLPFPPILSWLIGSIADCVGVAAGLEGDTSAQSEPLDIHIDQQQSQQRNGEKEARGEM